jgi:hypothetical protein
VGTADVSLEDPFVYACDGRTFEVGRAGRDWVIAVHGRDRYERVARFDERFEEGEVVVSPALAAQRRYPLEHPLDELVLVHRLAREGGLILLGSVVIREGRALAFVGQDSATREPEAESGLPPGSPAREHLASGRGWRRLGDPLLAPNHLVLRIADLGVRVYGTPWQARSGLASPASARLDAVHVIRPAKAVYAERLHGAAACSELLAHVIAPVHDPESPDRLLRVVEQVARRVSVTRLGMPEENRVVPFTWGQRHAALAFAPPFMT